MPTASVDVPETEVAPPCPACGCREIVQALVRPLTGVSFWATSSFPEFGSRGVGMPRVTLGHTGRDLTANRATVVIFMLINAAAVARVVASWTTDAMIMLMALSAICWIAAFGLFEIVYGPMLLTRRFAQI